MSSTLMLFVSMMTMAILSDESLAVLPAQCNSGYLDELPLKLRKICVAIARIQDIRNMNDFVDNRGNRLSTLNHPVFIPLYCEANDSLIYLMNDERLMSCEHTPSLHVPLPSLLAIAHRYINLCYRHSKTYTILNARPEYATPCSTSSDWKIDWTAMGINYALLAFELLSEYRENLPRYNSAVKRQDDEHYFLRFGKRR